MNALVDAYPGVDIVDIHPLMPEGWSALIQQEINDAANAYQSLVDINFWDGMTSVPGYGPIRFMDHDVQQGHEPQQGDLGHRVHLRPEPDVRDVQPSTLELGVRLQPNRLGSVRLGERRSDGRPRPPVHPRRSQPSLPPSASGAQGAHSPTTRTAASTPPSTTRRTFPACRPQPPRASSTPNRPSARSAPSPAAVRPSPSPARPPTTSRCAPCGGGRPRAHRARRR